VSIANAVMPRMAFMGVRIVLHSGRLLLDTCA
jgi:hypothetical protein